MIHSFIHLAGWIKTWMLFIHTAICLTTGPQPLPERVLLRVRSSTSYFNSQYSLVSLKSSSSCLCLLPFLSMISIPLIIPFSRQFIRKMWPTHAAFLLFILHSIFLSWLSLCNSFSFLTQSVQNDLLHPCSAPRIKIFHLFLNYFPKCPIFSTIECHAPSL